MAEFGKVFVFFLITIAHVYCKFRGFFFLRQKSFEKKKKRFVHARIIFNVIIA